MDTPGTADKLKFEEIKNCYMLATVAVHKWGNLTGDFSSKEPSLCFIYVKNKDYLVGRWVLRHIDYYDVEFPKTTTRALKEEEILKYPPELRANILKGVFVKKLNEFLIKAGGIE
jgi:hypothetical protein